MDASASDATGPQLSALPDRVAPEALRELDGAALDAAAAELSTVEREVRTAMAPFERHLRELRARADEIATERRRRERAERQAARHAVREQAGSGTMPALVDALAAADAPLADDISLEEVRAFLTTGGEVRFGFPTRPGTIAFTDGRRTTQAKTFGEARRLYGEGWETGAPGIPGVRVHLVGTKIERVVGADQVVVRVAGE